MQETVDKVEKLRGPRSLINNNGADRILKGYNRANKNFLPELLDISPKNFAYEPYSENTDVGNYDTDPRGFYVGLTLNHFLQGIGLNYLRAVSEVKGYIGDYFEEE